MSPGMKGAFLFACDTPDAVQGVFFYDALEFRSPAVHARLLFLLPRKHCRWRLDGLVHGGIDVRPSGLVAVGEVGSWVGVRNRECRIGV